MQTPVARASPKDDSLGVHTPTHFLIIFFAPMPGFSAGILPVRADDELPCKMLSLARIAWAVAGNRECQIVLAPDRDLPLI